MASSTFVTLFRKVTAWANAEINRGRKRFWDRHLRSRDSIVDRQAANLASAAAALAGKPMAEVAAGAGKTAIPGANAPQGQPARKREAIQASTDPEEMRKSAEAQKTKVDEMAKAIIVSAVSLNLPPSPDVARAATWEEFRDARAAQLRDMRATQTSQSKEPWTNALPLKCPQHLPTAEEPNLAQIEDALTGESRDEIATDGHQGPPVQTPVDELSLSNLKTNRREPLEVLKTYLAFQNARAKAETHEYQFRPKEYARLEKNGQLDLVLNERTMSAWNILADARKAGQNLIEAQELAFPSILLPGEKDEEPQPRLSMRSENDNSQVTIKPEEDARLPILGSR
jgi:hypothetical protein